VWRTPRKTSRPATRFGSRIKIRAGRSRLRNKEAAGEKEGEERKGRKRPTRNEQDGLEGRRGGEAAAKEQHGAEGGGFNNPLRRQGERPHGGLRSERWI